MSVQKRVHWSSLPAIQKVKEGEDAKRFFLSMQNYSHGHSRHSTDPQRQRRGQQIFMETSQISADSRSNCELSIRCSRIIHTETKQTLTQRAPHFPKYFSINFFSFWFSIFPNF